MRRVRVSSLALVALALASAVSGCSAGRSTSAPEVELENGATLRVKLTEYKVTPQRVDIKARKDGVARLTLVAENRGRIPHDLAIGRGGFIIGRTTTIKPGQTAVAKGFRLPVGTYRIFCTLSNHDTLGQYGFLVVK